MHKIAFHQCNKYHYIPLPSFVKRHFLTYFLLNQTTRNRMKYLDLTNKTMFVVLKMTKHCMNRIMKKIFPSKLSIVGTFAVLSFVLTVPMVVLFAQQQQNLQSSAAAPSPTFELPNIATQAPSGSISGYVYNDLNKNGLRDPGESGFPGVTVTISTLKNGDFKNRDMLVVYQAKTDTNGYFTYKLTNSNPETLTYFVAIQLPIGYKTIDTNPDPLSNLQKDSVQVVQFGLFPLASITQTVQPTCTPRPACLTTVQRCFMALPVGGWCPNPTIQQSVPILSPAVRSSISPHSPSVVTP